MEKTVSRPPKRASWGKRIGIAAAVIIVLLVALYFVGTSSAFLKSVVLPKAGNAINAKITVDDISVSPFSRAEIRGLRVQTTGSEPLLTAAEVRVRYSVFDIIRGNIVVSEVLLSTPVVQIVQEPDGTSNLDPILKRQNKSSESKSNGTTKLSIHNVALQNGTVRQVVKSKDGGTDRTELSGLNITLDQLGNGQSGKLTLASNFEMQQMHGSTNSELSGQISGGYDIALNQSLMPETVKGSTKLGVLKADGSYKELAGVNSSLDADLTPKELRQIALRFARNGQQLGQIRASGPIDTEKKEGTLNIEVLSIDKNVLALVTAGKGLDFGNAVINSTNQLTISQGGKYFAVKGNLAGNRISITQGTLVTPEMNLNANYQAGVNTAEKTALIERLDFTGESRGKPFLLTQLDRQMNLSWGETVKGYKDAALRVIVTNFNIADWRAAIGTNVESGVVNATISLAAQQDGKLLKTDFGADITGLAAQFGSNRLDNAGVHLEAAGTVGQLKNINISKYAVTLQQANAPVLQAEGAARYSLDTKETSAQLGAEAALANLLALAKLPDAKAQSGTLKISAKYSDSGGKKSAIGNMLVSDFTGSFGSCSFTNYQAAFDYNVGIQNDAVTISQAAVNLKQGSTAGGSVDLKGDYDLAKKTGQFTFKTIDLNQNALAPVLAASLGENRLESISLNASGNAKLDPQGENAVKAEVKIANWVVRDPAGKLPGTPLAVDLDLDGSMRQQTLDLRQLLVQLTPTARAKNALTLQAKLDLSKTNAAPGTIAIKSESFDVTPYYDLFAGGSKTNAAAQRAPASPAQAQTAAAPNGSPEEPKPISLPFQNLTANLEFDRLYLREVAISNWTGTATIHSNTVVLNPFKMVLNGGPVDLNASIDTGVPGYKYKVAFKADSVPLAPLANSFGSGDTNRLQGNFMADAQLDGAGITGPNLKRNLGGSVNVNLTNLNYQVVGPKLQRILVPISLALRVPELSQTPINWVSAQSQIANGTVTLKHLGVESEAFYAESAGTITLADVITNSPLNLPIDLSLRYAVAQKAGLLSNDTPTNAKYAKLPRFVTIKGTVGAPDPDINKLAVFGTLAREAAAFGLGNAKTEKVLGSVGSLLTGQQGSTNGAGTNSVSAGSLLQGVTGLLGGNSATNSTNGASSKEGGLLQGLGGLLGGRPQNTNAASGTNAAPAGTNAVREIFDLFGGRKNKK